MKIFWPEKNMYNWEYEKNHLKYMKDPKLK